MRYQLTELHKKEIEEARRKNRNKRVEKRLLALSLRADGVTLKDISSRTGFAMCSVSLLIRKYCTEGIEAITGNHYGGNRRNMSFEEETALLERFQKEAEQGHMLDVKALAQEYEKAVGHSISSGQIYRVLKRHGWRKVMPRSRHPKKASDEDMASSKKLKLESAN